MAITVEELKQNNMARINGSGFKMKQSPAKGLSNFFSSLGKKATSDRQTKQIQENQGMTNFEKKMADKAAQRKSGGKSKFQRAAAERKANKAAAAAGDARNAADKKARLDANAKAKAYKPKKKKVVKKEKKVITPKVVKKKNNTGPRVDKVEKKVITPKNIAQDIKPTPGPLNPKYAPKKGDKEMTLEEFKKITKPKSKSKKILSNIFKPGFMHLFGNKT